MQRKAGQSGGVPSSGDVRLEALEIITQIILRRTKSTMEEWQNLIEQNRKAHASNIGMQGAFYQLAYSGSDPLQKVIARKLLCDTRLSIELVRAESGSIEL